MSGMDEVTVSDGEQPGPEPTGKRQRRHLPAWIELPLVIILAVFLAFLVKTFIVQIFYIPSGSMENTLLIGDRVAVNKFVYRFSDPERGNVVVFDGVGSFLDEAAAAPDEGPVVGFVKELGRTVGLVPPPDTVFVKRVIGVGGDRVACCNDQGQITVNGVPIDESAYLYPGDVPSQTPFDVVVPEGKLWVMGDHRSASADSRAHQGEPGGGFVPVDAVLGKAFAIIWPWDQIQWVDQPVWADQLNEETLTP
ncbi:MAG: signal peptidase I [Actinobacteria bacterium]|nr:signal peptidase I [Actinomycetota bacterium]